MIRAFIAIELSEEVRAAIGEAQARLKRVPLSVKVTWVKPANLHLTLQFLGHVDEGKLDPIKAALAAVAGAHPAQEVTVAGAGAFPDLERARVLWVGCDDADGRLKTLAEAVQRAMLPLGFEPERRGFSAHLTLGRVKFPRPDAALTKALDSLKDTFFGKMRVDALHLFESQLHPEGSVYSKLSSHALA